MERLHVMDSQERIYHYVAAVDTSKPPTSQLSVWLFATNAEAVACLTGLLAGYGIPYRVWKALHSVLGEDALPCMRQGVCFSMGIKRLS